MSSKRNCDCDSCKDNHDFAISTELLQELCDGKVTLFAGAGVSTEAKKVLPRTLHDDVAIELGNTTRNIAFPELMEKYCQQPNGRSKLLEKITLRFDYIDSFPELNRTATRFHRELGTFFPIRNIITTNWDTYFEQFCKATPFVADSDLAFWEAAPRRVLKIHGSVNNYGSIVATNRDYKKSQRRLNVGILGGLLKTILATQTVIFIGYSCSDSDFIAINKFVKRQMNLFHRQAYVVTPVAADCDKFRTIGFIPIQTDGTNFLAQVKAHAVANGVMYSDDNYNKARSLLDILRYEHIRMCTAINPADWPEIIYVACYQDGLKNALDRATNVQGSGEYSRPGHLSNVMRDYHRWQKKKLRQGKYEDVAYIEGYINGLTYFLMNNEERAQVEVPRYFVFGLDAFNCNFKKFLAVTKRKPCLHKAARKRALHFVKRLSDPSSIDFHHPPWL